MISKIYYYKSLRELQQKGYRYRAIAFKDIERFPKKGSLFVAKGGEI